MLKKLFIASCFVSALFAAQEVTFAIIKPDAVAAHHVGEILTIIEQSGFQIVAMEMRTIDRSLVEHFYAEHKGKPFFARLTSFMTSGPVVTLALKRENAVASWRQLMGATDPQKAALGTIRARFAKNMDEGNAVHGSDSVESAQHELGIFFPMLKIKQTATCAA